MRLFIFQSVSEPDVLGFTTDATGANLPAALAPWTQAGGGNAMATGAGEASLAGIGASEPVIAAVQRDGFYIAKSEVITRGTGLPWVH